MEEEVAANNGIYSMSSSKKKMAEANTLLMYNEAKSSFFTVQSRL